jgi:hypothetical protein
MPKEKNALPPPAPQAAKKRDFLDDESDEDDLPVSLEAAAPKLRVNEGFARKLEVREQRKRSMEAKSS